ncbi:MAG: flagellar motor switch protein FliN [Gammaproteobacteria bacterium]|nr:flagellar motor switch protein FliN [Gammaproteobacteria bacterium]
MTTSSDEQVAERTTTADPETAAPAQFDELTDNGAQASADEVDLNVILDVPVTLALEVGRTKMTIRDLLKLNQGSLVELDRPADQPMDLLVNGTLVAHAEIVVVEDMFGIRLIDVVSPSERIRNLK